VRFDGPDAPRFYQGRLFSVVAPATSIHSRNATGGTAKGAARRFYESTGRPSSIDRPANSSGFEARRELAVDGRTRRTRALAPIDERRQVLVHVVTRSRSAIGRPWGGARVFGPNGIWQRDCSILSAPRRCGPDAAERAGAGRRSSQSEGKARRGRASSIDLRDVAVRARMPCRAREFLRDGAGRGKKANWHMRAQTRSRRRGRGRRARLGGDYSSDQSEDAKIQSHCFGLDETTGEGGGGRGRFLIHWQTMAGSARPFHAAARAAGPVRENGTGKRSEGGNARQQQLPPRSRRVGTAKESRRRTTRIHVDRPKRSTPAPSRGVGGGAIFAVGPCSLEAQRGPARRRGGSRRGRGPGRTSSDGSPRRAGGPCRRFGDQRARPKTSRPSARHGQRGR